jgi:hypothetical protein
MSLLVPIRSHPFDGWMVRAALAVFALLLTALLASG